jgi:hypothetical protein
MCARYPVPNPLGVSSLVLCAAVCVLVLALLPPDHIFEGLWVMAPYVALAISSAVAWRSRFFSRWVFACSVFTTLTNPAIYLLVYLAFGGHENSSNTWTFFSGPVVMWSEIGAFLAVSVIVRVVQSVLSRRKSLPERTDKRA